MVVNQLPLETDEPYAQILSDRSEVAIEVIQWFLNERVLYVVTDVSDQEIVSPYDPHPPSARIIIPAYGERPERVSQLFDDALAISNLVLNPLVRRRELLGQSREDIEHIHDHMKNWSQGN